MENDEIGAQEALTEVDRVRDLNARRLRRPNRYWLVIATLLSLWVLAPLIYAVVPEPYGYLLPVALVPVIAVVFLWRKPRDMRIRYTLDESMFRQLVTNIIAPFVVLMAASAGLFGLLGWWWVPPVTAGAMFAVAYLRFRTLDRQWAHAVSHRE